MKYFFFSDRDDVLFASVMISVEIAIASCDVRTMLTGKLRTAREMIRGNKFGAVMHARAD